MATGAAAAEALSPLGLNLEGVIGSETQVLLDANLSLVRYGPFELVNKHPADIIVAE